MAQTVLWFFEFGYILQHLATLFQIYIILKKNKIDLISIETNILFLIGAVARTGWIYDSMLKNFFLAYVELFMAYSCLITIIYLYYKKEKTIFSTYTVKPFYTKLYFLIPVAVLFAFLFHPGNKNEYYYTSQQFVSLSIFSEAIGLVPQLWIMREEKDTGSISHYYVFFLAFARFFRLIFWINMYFNQSHFYSLIIADFVHCFALSGFVYNFIKNWNKVLLPTSSMDDSRKKMF